MASTILIFVFVFAQTSAFGRFVRSYDMKTLVAKSELVFVGRVKAVKPSSITTTLSYPTWQGVTFEWLKVEVEVLEPVKGSRKGDLVQTAMLSVQPELLSIQPEILSGKASRQVRPMYDPPGMLEPKEGNVFLLCLMPTTVTNMFAAVTAPFDEDQSIFRLDRNDPDYRSYGQAREVDRISKERHDVISSLVTDAAQIFATGADQMRRTYAMEIQMVPSKAVIHLQWQAHTNSAGWVLDVPERGVTKTNGIPKTAK